MHTIAELHKTSMIHGSNVALDDINLSAAEGRVLSLVGPNGSGKTTTLTIMAGLQAPTRGEAVVCGHPAASRQARTQMAYIPDAFTGLDELTILEYCHLVARLHRNDQASARAAELLEVFGLGERLDSPLSSLSMGMRRQVSIAAAASLKPAFLLIDEATATLDPEAVVVLRTVLRSLAETGTAVLAATQDLAFAQSVSDDVAVLISGRLVLNGHLEDLLYNHGCSTMEGLFLKVLDHAGHQEKVRDALAC